MLLRIGKAAPPPKPARGLLCLQRSEHPSPALPGARVLVLSAGPGFLFAGCPGPLLHGLPPTHLPMATRTPCLGARRGPNMRGKERPKKETAPPAQGDREQTAPILLIMT